MIRVIKMSPRNTSPHNSTDRNQPSPTNGVTRLCLATKLIELVQRLQEHLQNATQNAALTAALNRIQNEAVPLHFIITNLNQLSTLEADNNQSQALRSVMLYAVSNEVLNSTLYAVPNEAFRSELISNLNLSSILEDENGQSLMLQNEVLIAAPNTVQNEAFHAEFISNLNEPSNPETDNNQSETLTSQPTVDHPETRDKRTPKINKKYCQDENCGKNGKLCESCLPFATMHRAHPITFDDVEIPADKTDEERVAIQVLLSLYKLKPRDDSGYRSCNTLNPNQNQVNNANLKCRSNSVDNQTAKRVKFNNADNTPKQPKRPTINETPAPIANGVDVSNENNVPQARKSLNPNQNQVNNANLKRRSNSVDNQTAKRVKFNNADNTPERPTINETPAPIANGVDVSNENNVPQARKRKQRAPRVSKNKNDEIFNLMTDPDSVTGEIAEYIKYALRVQLFEPKPARKARQPKENKKNASNDPVADELPKSKVSKPRGKYKQYTSAQFSAAFLLSTVGEIKALTVATILNVPTRTLYEKLELVPTFVWYKSVLPYWKERIRQIKENVIYENSVKMLQSSQTE